MAKGSSSGGGNMQTVMSWSIGVASIAFLGLIMLILFGNLSGNVGFTQDSVVITVTNESAYVAPVHANLTGYLLSGYNTTWSSITLTDLLNSTDGSGAPDGEWNFSITTGNGTISSVGVLTNATTLFEFDNVSASYTYSHSYDSIGLANTNNFINNYTQSVLNTGEQFPTVGTIIGVALLLFILISLLVFALVRLAKIGGSGGNFG